MINKRIIIAAIATAALALPATVFALNGPCVDCHTMHNSQNGTTVVQPGGSAPIGQLLKANGCIGCHAFGTNDATLGYTVGQIINGAPQVNDATNPLAGGYFNALGDAFNHNVKDFGDTADALITSTNAPGNAGSTITIAIDDGSGGAVLSCSTSALVTTGCHAATGAHHDNGGREDIINATSTSGSASYRFLSGVSGREDSNYEVTTTVDEHNYYSTNMNTFCARCHDDFHGLDQGTGVSPWLRHPTDEPLTALGAYGTSATATWGPYDADVPVGINAATVPTTDLDITTAATVQVLCISCHRPHGSSQADMLRFSYSQMTAGTGYDATLSGGVGCFGCHTDK